MVGPPIAQLSDIEIDAAILADAHKILEWRKRGLSHYEIGLKIEKPVSEVKRIEEQCRSMVFSAISPVIENDRALRICQLDQVIRDARSIAEAAYEYSEKLAALNTITKAIGVAAKITGLESSKPINVTNMLVQGTNEIEFLKDLIKYKELNGQS